VSEVIGFVETVRLKVTERNLKDGKGSFTFLSIKRAG
jgi:hypothetical protein